MADITWPVNDPDFWPEGQEDNLEFDVELAVKRNGGIETLALPGARWRGAVTFPPDSVANIRRRRRQEAFIASLKGGANRLLLWNLLTPEPLGTLRGTLTLASSVAAGANTATFNGGLASPNLIAGSSFEIDTNADGVADGWTQYTSGTVGTVASDTGSAAGGAVYGAKVQRVTSTGLGTTTSDRVGVFRNAVSVSALAGQAVAVSAAMYASVAAARLMIYVEWRDSGGTLISTLQGPNTQPVVGGVTLARYSVAGTVPSNAVTANLFFWSDSRPGSAGALDFYIDGVQLEQAAAASSFAGFATLLRGDRFSFGGQRFKATADAVANDAGQITVSFEPSARAAASSGAAVTVVRPTSRFVVTSPLVPSFARGTELPGFTVELVEAP